MTNFELVSLIFTGIQTLVIVLTLWAVYRQLKQLNEVNQDNAYTKNLDDYSELIRLLLDNPELNKIFYSRNAEFQKLDKAGKDFYNFAGLAVGFLERLWTLRQKGLIEGDTWKTWERWIKEQWFPLDEFNSHWTNEGKYFHPGFFKEIDDLYASFRTERENEGTVIGEGTQSDVSNG